MSEFGIDTCTAERGAHCVGTLPKTAAGTTAEQPNWRRKLPESTARLRANARLTALADRRSALRRG
jgi:hypothetical protein